VTAPTHTLPPVEELPQLDADPALCERADAARNRRRVLAAAAKLFAERGVDRVSMDDVAHEAGVGKGTLYRRFGDRATLALSLLSERDAALQEEMIRGAPPLGPGAPACDRLRAFGQRLLELREDSLDILVAAERSAPVERYESRPYAAYRLHLRLLLQEAAPSIDTEMAAEALLTLFSADLLFYLRRHREIPMQRIVDAWHATLDGLLAQAY
jgi:AcrR family transcriptional regulator